MSALQGTPFFPDLEGAILLLESPLREDKATPSFAGVKGLAFCRFLRDSLITDEVLAQIVSAKPELSHLPIVAGLDFGHTRPCPSEDAVNFTLIEIASLSA